MVENFDFTSPPRRRQLVIVGVATLVVLVLLLLGGLTAERRGMRIAVVGAEDYAAFLACNEFVSDELGVPLEDLQIWDTFRVESPYDETRMEMVVYSWIAVTKHIGGPVAYEYECSVRRVDGRWELDKGGVEIRRKKSDEL